MTEPRRTETDESPAPQDAEAASALAPRERARAAFDRAQAAHRPFGVLAVALADRELYERVLGGVWLAEAEDRMHARAAATLSPGPSTDSALLFEEGRLLAWLPGVDAAAAIRLATELRARLDAESAAPHKLRALVGVASSSASAPPYDPRLVLELLEGVAREGLEVAGLSGEGVVHSELYEGLLRGLERREPELLARQARRIADLRRPPAPPPPSAPSRTQSTTQSTTPSRTPSTTGSPPAPPAPILALPTPPIGTAAGLGPPPAPSGDELPRVPPRGAEPTPSPAEPRAPLPATPRGPRPASLADDAVGVRLAGAVRGLLSELGGDRADPRIEDRISALVLEHLEEARRAAAAEVERRMGAEVELLRRRVAKLKHSLDEVELELDHVVRQPVPPDQGYSSAYRDVQGLTPTDTFYDLKRDLMAEIFRANLALLRARVDDAG